MIPPSNSAPYDYWYTILSAARRRLGQSVPSLIPYLGSILDQTQADCLQAARNAFRRQQDAMTELGSRRFKDSIVIEGIPIVATDDPAIDCYISWTEIFDGVSSQTTPVLPSNLRSPIWMSERQNGVNAVFPPPNVPNMTPQPDGLPKRIKQLWNRSWQWRNETLYYPGALQSVDFWIYFVQWLPDPADVGSTPWFMTQIPIMWCQDSLTWWLCKEYAITAISKAAGEPDSPAAQMIAANALGFVQQCDTEGEKATKRLVNQTDTGIDVRSDVRRVPYGAGRGSGSQWGR